MKGIFCILSLFFVAQCAQSEDLLRDRLSVFFTNEGPPKGFWAMPTQPSMGWERPPEDTNADIITLCPKGDPTFCIFYKNNHIAGIDIGLPAEWLYSSFNRGPDSFVHDTVRLNVSLKAVTIYLTPPGEDPNPDLVGTGMWILKNDGSLFAVNLNAQDNDIPNYPFTKENCFPGMGLHYYFNMTSELDCNLFEPIFLLYNNNQLSGFGFQMLGASHPYNVNWFENIPTQAIKMIVPTAPKCLAEVADKEGINSIHVYFIKDPWTISCP